MVNSQLLLWSCRADRLRRAGRFGRPDSSGDASVTITIVARLTANNNTILDYYVLPLAVLAARPSLWLGPTNAAAFEAYRFDKLDRFCELVGRSPVPVAG
jgi:hypothetical protein